MARFVLTIFNAFIGTFLLMAFLYRVVLAAYASTKNSKLDNRPVKGSA